MIRPVLMVFVSCQTVTVPKECKRKGSGLCKANDEHQVIVQSFRGQMSSTHRITFHGFSCPTQTGRREKVVICCSAVLGKRHGTSATTALLESGIVGSKRDDRSGASTSWPGGAHSGWPGGSLATRQPKPVVAKTKQCQGSARCLIPFCRRIFAETVAKPFPESRVRTLRQTNSCRL